MKRRLLIVVLALMGCVMQAGPGSVPARAQSGDDRFGVILTSDDPEQVTAFGARWFIHAGASDLDPPEGTVMPRILRTNPPLDDATLRGLVQAHPGGYWLIGNEPNVEAVGNTTPAAYAEVLRRYADVIKRADARATLVGPNVLNWAFTCAGCPGFPSGESWTREMRAAYRTRYRAEPPLDVWSLHTYDLDWVRFPNGDARRQSEQVLGLRGWLDGIAELRDAPIWVTEAGIHWGYTGIRFRGGVAEPSGPYDVRAVSAYLTDYFTWLRDTADSTRVERWFLWALSMQGPESFATAYGGIALMDGDDSTAAITPLGRVYRRLAGFE